mgnify:CR=1 FL=1
MKNVKSKLMTLAMLAFLPTITLSAEIVEREFKGACDSRLENIVVIQKKQNKYTLMISVGGARDYLKNLSLSGDSFAIEFGTLNDKTSFIPFAQMNQSIQNSDESVMFKCANSEYSKENYLTYSLDVDTYELIAQQKFLKRIKKINHF